MTVRDIDAFMTYLASQLPSGASLSASAVRVALGDLLDTVRDKMLESKGAMNPSTSTVLDSTARRGDWWEISAAGSRDFGSGSITFAVGDIAWHNGSVIKKIPIATVMAVGTPSTGAALATGGDYLLASGGTYTVASPSENALITLRVAPGTTATVTGIGTLSNVSTTRVRVREFQYKSGVWKPVDDASGASLISTVSSLTDSGYTEGEEFQVNLGGASPKIARDFGSGSLNIYDQDRIIHDGTKQVVIPSSRLRLPWIRLNDLGLDDGPSVTLAQARSNSVKLREAVATLRTIHNNSINITGNGIFVFADEISNVHWPNYNATKQTVSNATYNRTSGTITLAAGGWTAIGLDGPNKVFRIEDDTNPANDGTYLTAEAFNSSYSYAIGDHVYQSGNVYSSPTVQAPQAFNAANWTLVGTANNVLALRNVISVTGLGLVKFPVNGTTASLGIVPLHTTVGGASQGKRSALSIQSPSSGSLVIKRYAGGTVVRRYANGLPTGVFTQDLPNGPAGVGSSEVYWDNTATIKGCSLYTPNGYAIHLDGTGHSGAMDFEGVVASSLGADYPCVFFDNCYSGQVQSLRILRCKGHGIVCNVWNTMDLACRVESAGWGGAAANEKHGTWLINCNGGRYHINNEGCSGLAIKETTCSGLTKGGYQENNNHGTDDGYDVGADFVAQVSFDGSGHRLGGMRVLNPGDEFVHFGVSWDGWKTPLDSEVNSNPNVFYDVKGLAKKLPEGGLSRDRRAVFTLKDFYNYYANSARYSGGCGGTLFGLNEAYFDGSWGTEKPYEAATPTAHNGSYASLEQGKLRFYFPANSHNAGLPGFPNRSMRWMDHALPALNASATAFTWVNSGAAAVAFAAKDFSTRRQYRVTVSGVDWWKLGVREGMDVDITGFTSDVSGADSDPNKRFSVVGIRDNLLFLKIREIDGGTEVTSLTESLSGITFAFDWPEQKFSVANMQVANNDILVIDVQYTVGAAYSWFKQFNKLKTRNDPQNDYAMWAATIGFTHASSNFIWRLWPRGPGVNRERIIWRNTTGSTWSPGNPTSSTNQIVISVCKQPNATQWPSATASPAYNLEFDMLDFIVCDGEKMGTT